MSDHPLYDAAVAYIDRGWSVVPLRGKVPITVGWADGVPSSKADAWAWFVEDGYDGIGVVCGAVSGGLIVVDVEGRLAADTERMKRVLAAAAEMGVGSLVANALLHACAHTPSGGIHLFFVITDADAPGNAKLAYARTDDGAYALLAETRGQGGQVAAPPGPGRGWNGDGGPGSSIPVTMDEWARIAAAFARLDESERLVAPPTPTRPRDDAFAQPGAGMSVADAFTAALMAGELTWADVLDPGWTLAGYDRDGRSLWLRPEYGGVKPTSAFSAKGYESYAGGEPAPVLVVHSSAVEHLPAGDGRRLTPFRVFARCWFDGDEALCARYVEDVVTGNACPDPYLGAILALPAGVLSRAGTIANAKGHAPAADVDADVAPTVLPPPPPPPPLERLDLATLPKVAREAVQAVADYTQTAPEIGAYLAVSALSAAAGNGLVVRGSWTEPLTMWTATAANPSERKSAVLSLLAVNPLIAAEQAIRDGMADLIVGWQGDSLALAAELMLAKEAVKGAKSDDERAAAARTAAEVEARLAEHDADKPFPPAIVLTDATPEAVMDVMAANRGNAGVFTAEGVFLGIVAGGLGNDKAPSPAVANLNSAWSREMIRSKRRQSRSVTVDKPSLSIGMTIQPDVMDVLASPKMTGTGFTARWLLARPPRYAGSRRLDVGPLDESALHRWTAILTAVMERSWQAGPAGDVLRVSLEAEGQLMEYRRLNEARIAVSNVDTEAWLGKAVGQAVRVAGLFALAIDPETPVVPGEAMRLALAFMEWAEKATLGLLTGRLSQYGDLSGEKDLRGHEHVTRWASSPRRVGRWFTIRDFLTTAIKPSRDGWWTVPDMKPAEVVRSVCDQLAAAGVLEMTAVDSQKVGVPMIPAYRVQPGGSGSLSVSGQSPEMSSQQAGSDEAGRTSWTGSLEREGSNSPSIHTSPSTPTHIHPPVQQSSSPASGLSTGCASCGTRLDPVLVEQGLTVHPGCPEPGDA